MVSLEMYYHNAYFLQPNFILMVPGSELRQILQAVHFLLTPSSKQTTNIMMLYIVLQSPCNNPVYIMSDIVEIVKPPLCLVCRFTCFLFFLSFCSLQSFVSLKTPLVSTGLGYHIFV